MAKKFLLVGLNTVRKDGEKNKRVRLAPGKAHDLNKDEIDLLDRLTAKTGKLHYRDPVNEGSSNDDDLTADNRSDADIFVDRNANEITDDEIAGLDADARAAAVEAEKAGRNRTTVIARLEAKPADVDGGL